MDFFTKKNMVVATTIGKHIYHLIQIKKDLDVYIAGKL